MIGENDIEKLASLARLELAGSMKSVLAGQVGSILEYVQQLDKVNTADVPPLSHTNSGTNVLREDVVVAASAHVEPQPLGETSIPQQAMLGEEELFRNTPDRSGRFIRVPLIVE